MRPLRADGDVLKIYRRLVAEIQDGDYAVVVEIRISAESWLSESLQVCRCRRGEVEDGDNVILVEVGTHNLAEGGGIGRGIGLCQRCRPGNG